MRSWLDKTLSDAFSRGLMYLTIRKARPASASSSVAHLWDNGRNVVDELANVMKVRAAALQRFGETIFAKAPRCHARRRSGAFTCTIAIKFERPRN